MLTGFQAIEDRTATLGTPAWRSKAPVSGSEFETCGRFQSSSHKRGWN